MQAPKARGKKITATCPAKNRENKTKTRARCRSFAPGASTQVKGLLGAGESSGVDFKGKPTPGKSAVPQAEVAASYRRQAEQELNSERVPDALKETITKLFSVVGGSEK